MFQGMRTSCSIPFYCPKFDLKYHTKSISRFQVITLVSVRSGDFGAIRKIFQVCQHLNKWYEKREDLRSSLFLCVGSLLVEFLEFCLKFGKLFLQVGFHLGLVVFNDGLEKCDSRFEFGLKFKCIIIRNLNLLTRKEQVDRIG